MACGSKGAPAQPDANPAGMSARQQLEQAQERVLLLDAALKHHEAVLHDMEARGGDAAELATQRKKIEAVRLTLEAEERRLRTLRDRTSKGG